MVDGSAQISSDVSQTIEVSFDNGTTWQTVDLTNNSSLAIPDNKEDIQVRVTTLTDLLIESVEDFELKAWVKPDASDSVSSNVDIIDTTPHIIVESLSASPQSVEEGNSVVFDVRLSVLQNNAPLYIDLTDISANLGSDYSGVIDVSLDGGNTWQTIDLSVTDNIGLSQSQTLVKIRVNALTDAIEDDNETFKLSLSAQQDRSNPSEKVVTIIDVGNSAPTAVDDVATGTGDVPLTNINVLANDTDSDGDTLSIQGVPTALHGTVTVNADGTLNYTPDANFNGTDTITYVVTDGSLTSTANVTVSVSAVNDSPVAVDDTATATEDTPLTNIDVLTNDTDVDGDTLTIVGVPTAEHGTVTVNPDGTLNYTPDPDYSGPDTITYVVTDGTITDTGTVSVNVISVNDAPTAVDDVATGSEDVPLTNINVLSNDTDSDGDTLSIQGVPTALHGTVTVNADGTLNYTPDANFNGTDTITYVVTDGSLTSTANVTVSVSAVNDSPVAVDDTATATEDTPLTNIDVLTNDTDVDGDTLTIEGVPTAEHGTVTVNPDGTLNYTPDPDYSGPDTISYVVTDGTITDTGTVSVNVISVNDAPTAVDDVATGSEDTPLTNINVLANDSDSDGDTLSIQGVPTALHGTVTVNADGTLNYTPDANFNGTDTITYVVTDGSLTSTANVIVSVSAVNDAPVAVDDNAITSENTPLANIDVLTNDTDVDGDTLSIQGVPTALHGTVTVNPDGTLNYIPNPNYSGPDTITYVVTDGTITDTGTVSVNVININDAPVAVDDVASATENTTLSNINVLANDTDPDGDTLSIKGVPTALHGTVTVNADGTLNYTPNANFFGADIITYVVTDGELTDTGVVAVAVISGNEDPDAVDDSNMLIDINATASNYTGAAQTCNKLEGFGTTTADDTSFIANIDDDGSYTICI